MQNQIYSFLVFILNGFLIGILFDIFRISRKSFKTPDFITYIEDIAFWIGSGMLLLFSIFKFNNGELRVFIFIGLFLGISTYLLIFSKLFINISLHIINVVKKSFYILIILPINYILKFINLIIIKPLKFVYKKLFKMCKKNMSVINIILEKMFHKNRL